jgi:hypothetical protein
MVDAPTNNTSSTETPPKPEAPVVKTACEMNDAEYAALKKSLGIRTNFPGYLGIKNHGRAHEAF